MKCFFSMTSTQKTIDNKIKEAYEKYAPKNITLEQFTSMIEQDPKLLKDIGGKFSTFNLKASIYFNTYFCNNNNYLREQLRDYTNIEAIEQGALEYAKIYEKIICSNDSIIEAALNFHNLNEQEKQDLAYKIIQGINKYFNIDSKLNVEYYDRHKGEEVKQHKFELIEKFLNLFKFKRINYGLKGQYIGNETKIVQYKAYNFLEFINTLAHEYGHFIDEEYPHLGMLGTQIANYSYRCYTPSKHKDYKIQPAEVSSFKIGEVVEKHLQNVLIEQGKKRLQPLKVKLAGLRLQEEKINDKLYKAKRDVLRERGLYDLKFEKRMRMFKKLEKDKSCTKIQKLLQQKEQANAKYWKLWHIIFEIEYMLKQHNEQQIQMHINEKQM